MTILSAKYVVDNKISLAQTTKLHILVRSKQSAVRLILSTL
jgi:hypothetical protein